MLTFYASLPFGVHLCFMIWLLCSPLCAVTYSFCSLNICSKFWIKFRSVFFCSCKHTFFPSISSTFAPTVSCSFFGFRMVYEHPTPFPLILSSWFILVISSFALEKIGSECLSSSCSFNFSNFTFLS